MEESERVFSSSEVIEMAEKIIELYGKDSIALRPNHYAKLFVSNYLSSKDYKKSVITR